MLKKILIIFAIVIVLIVILVIAGLSLTKHNYGDRTEVLKATSANPKKALVVYQPSLTKASHDVAYALAKGLNDCGYEVTISNPGEHLSADVSPYSIVVLGSPNYGSSVAVPLKDYVKRVGDFSGKRMILFATSGATEVMPELDKLAELLGGTEPYAEVKYKFNDYEKNNDAAYQLGVEAAR